MKRQLQMLLFVVFGMMLLASAVSAAHQKYHRHESNLSMNDNDEGRPSMNDAMPWPYWLAVALVALVNVPSKEYAPPFQPRFVSVCRN